MSNSPSSIPALETPPEIKELLTKYHAGRIPPIDELVRREILDVVYHGYVETHKIHLAILWPAGDPARRSSWEDLRGINNTSLHGPFCTACRAFTSNGICPLEAACARSDVDRAWEAATSKQTLVYVCHNGLIDMAMPVVLNSATIAVLFTGQLYPQPGPIWDTAHIGGVPENRPNFDLREFCLQQIRQRQRQASNFADLERLVSQHRVVSPDDLETYRRSLTDAHDILLELATTRLQLERHRLTSHFRGSLFTAPHQPDRFWQFLQQWFANWRLPDDAFVLGLLQTPDNQNLAVHLSLGLPNISLRKYPLGDKSLWSLLRDLPRDGRPPKPYSCKNLLAGCYLPSPPALVVPLGRRGFLILGRRSTPGEPPFLDYGYAAVAEFSRDIALLLDDLVLAEAQDEFLTSFSHELRSPITFATATVERFRLGRFAHDSKLFDDNCRRLQAQLNRLLKLIEGVWHLQRVLAGQVTYTRQRLKLYDVLAHCASQCKDASTREDLTIVVDRDSFGDMSFHLDPAAFDLLAFNLLENAIKYSSPNTEIRVYARRTSQEVILTFTNIGIPLPDPKDLDIFARFARGPEARCISPQSAGIGLFLVRHVVEGHGGSVSANSVPHGPINYLVTFEIRLPA